MRHLVKSRQGVSRDLSGGPGYPRPGGFAKGTACGAVHGLWILLWGLRDGKGLHHGVLQRRRGVPPFAHRCHTAVPASQPKDARPGERGEVPFAHGASRQRRCNRSSTELLAWQRATARAHLSERRLTPDTRLTRDTSGAPHAPHT